MNIKRSTKRLHGMTLIEAMVVIGLLVVLVAMLLPSRASVHVKASRISCLNNLKEIGTAYHVWEMDNGDKYPMQQAEALGGMQGLLSNTINAGRYAYLPYSLMQNEMGQSPKLVLCPKDDRTANTNFYWGPANSPPPVGTNIFTEIQSGSFDNSNVSYFVGVGASDAYPQSILGGDRNLGSGGVINVTTGEVRSPEQDRYYGISGKKANPGFPCGADAIVNTNGQWASSFIAGGGGHVGNGSQAVAWSAKMHSAGSTAGAGNILLGDGSAQQCNSASLRKTWLRYATNLGNFAATDTNHTVANGSIRLLFP